MPQYIEIPGHGTVEFPDGMSEDDIGRAIKRNILVGKPTNMPVPNPNDLSYLPQNPTSGMSDLDLARAGAGKYLTDTGHGARQLGVETLAEALRPRVGPARPDVFGVGDYAQQLRQEETERSARDKPLMATGPGKAGYVGAGVLSTVPAGMAGIGRAALAPRSILQGGLSGGVQGAVMPVGEEGSRTGNVMTGAALGAGLNAAAQVPSRIAQPIQNISPQAKTLLKEDVVPTVGQAMNKDTVLGKFLAGAEEKAQSIPLIGDIISHGRNRAVTDLNKAAVKRAGGEGAGNDAIDQAHRTLNDTFENLALGQKVKLDNTFKVNYSDLTLTEDARKILKAKQDDIFKAAQNGELTADAYMKFRRELNEAGARQKNDLDLGMGLKRLAAGLDGAFEAQAPPATKAAWAQARDQWANLKIVEDAASKAMDKKGVFTPGQLAQSVAHGKQGGKSATARGNARMQDLAEAGLSLKSGTADSGTAGRMLMAAMLGGGGVGAGMAAPATIPFMAGAAGGGLLYGSRAGSRYALGDFPMQGILSNIMKQPVPAATQAGRLYMQN